MPTMRQVHYDKYLTNISLGYKNEAFIADQIFKTVPVDKQSDKYYVFGMEAFKVHDDVRAPGTESTDIDFTWSSDSYFLEGHAKGTWIPDEEYANADEVIAQELDANSTELTTAAILMNKEILAAKKLTDTSLVATGLHDVPSVKWSDLVNSNPQIDIQNARELLHKKSGLRPNTLILSEPVYNKLIFNKKIMAILSITSLQMLSMEMLKTILGVDNILIGSALKDTTAYGSATAPALDYVWGESAVLCYIAPGAVGRKTRTLCAGFYWSAKGTNGVGVRKWWDEAKQATKVESEHWYDLKIISNNSSYIFEDVLA